MEKTGCGDKGDIMTEFMKDISSKMGKVDLIKVVT